MLNKQSTQLLNQLELHVYTANPEIVHYCKDGFPGWLLTLLAKYPSASKLSRAKIKSLAKIPYITKDRATQLIENAKKSVAAEADMITDQLITATVNQILQIKKTIKSQTQIMARNCALPEVELLKTFNGISDYSAIGLILQIQSVERFASVKKMASFYGLHPVFKTSGDGSTKARMSKKGSKEIRHILFMVAFASIRHNPLISRIYKERLEKGMAKMAAIGYCMHKILRIIYGMLKNNTAFDPAIDQKNTEKIQSTRNKIRKDKNRRIQDYDAKAPVSRRQNIKRKGRNLSQGDPITVNGIAAPSQQKPNKNLSVCKAGGPAHGG
jgi:vacuolar-type H+-ATPase subunit H